MSVDPKSSHYDHGGIETIEIMKAKLTAEQYRGYLLGNIIKYSMRANWKSDFSRDIDKIKVYAGLLAEHERSESKRTQKEKNWTCTEDPF